MPSLPLPPPPPAEPMLKLLSPESDANPVGTPEILAAPPVDPLSPLSGEVINDGIKELQIRFAISAGVT